MTNWQIEVGRMTLYILFPIGIYYYFNKTENIEEWLKNERKRFGPTNHKQRKEFMQFIEDVNKNQQLKKLTEMEIQYQEMKMK